MIRELFNFHGGVKPAYNKDAVEPATDRRSRRYPTAWSFPCIRASAAYRARWSRRARRFSRAN